MVSPLPSFHGLDGEDATDFCDTFELACLLANYSNEMMLKAFRLVMKEEARTWYDNINKLIKEDWSLLKKSFLERYAPNNSMQDLLENLQWLRQEDLQSYVLYEEEFLHLLSCLDLSQEGGERLPDFVVKEYFVNGLCKVLQVKVLYETPNTFCEAIQVARLRYRRLMYKTYGIEVKLPKWKPTRCEAVTRDSPIMVATKSTVQASQVQDAPISINEMLSKPFEEVEGIKEVHMEGKRKVEKRRICDQVDEEEQLKPQLDSLQRVAVSHQHSRKMSRPIKTKKAVRQKIQENGFLLEALAFHSRGEGWVPTSIKNMKDCNDLECKETDVGSACINTKELSEESSMDAISKKELEVMVSPSIEQSPECFTSKASCRLEMVDVSSLIWKDDEGLLEMMDSSSSEVILENVASFEEDTLSVVDSFCKGWVITCYALYSLSLYLGSFKKEKLLASKDGNNMEVSPTKGEGWSIIICYNMTFREEDLCQEQTNKEEICKEDGKLNQQFIFQAEKEEDFWETKSISDEPDITLFLQNIKDEKGAIPEADVLPDDNLSLNSWELQNQGRPQVPLIFFDNNSSLPWEEDSMAESFAYEDSFDAEEDEYHWWAFTMFRENRNEEEDENQAILFLQEIERFLQNRIQGLERLLVSRRHLYHDHANILKAIKTPTWTTYYLMWDPGGYKTKFSGWRLKPYFSQVVEDQMETEEEEEQVSFDIKEPLGVIAQDPFNAQHVPCIDLMSLGAITWPCIDTVLCYPGTTSDHLVTNGEDESTNRLQRTHGSDTKDLEQEA